MNNHNLLLIFGGFLISSIFAETLYQDDFDNDTLLTNTKIGGGLIINEISNATWTDSGAAVFSTENTNFRRRALLYSENTFQSDEGLKLTVKYNTGSIATTGAHDLSFGLIRSDVDLASFSGYNPFRRDPSIYGVGINITPVFDSTMQGLTFANGTTVTALDQSGTNIQFNIDQVTEVTFAIGEEGAWSYSIDGVQEAAGNLPEGFDLDSDYHVVVYGQDDNGGGKIIESLLLEAAGPDLPDPYPEFLFHDSFDGDGLGFNSVKGGGFFSASPSGASWTDEDDAVYNNNGADPNQRAVMYSENSFRSETGFRLHVDYTTNTIGSSGSHNFSFGFISSDTDLANYSGLNPFQAESAVYSVGANLTTQGGEAFRGLNFSDGSTVVSLDTSGTRHQFVEGESTKVTIEISYGGYWCYRINGEYEASGALPIDFDLSRNYHIVVYGQDGETEKSIQSITLEKGYAQGERAAGLRGSWNCGQGDVNFLQNMKTVDSTLARLNEGASVSAEHNVPHRLLEMIAKGLSSVGGDEIFAPVPETWGDFDDDQPDSDRFLDEVTGIRNIQLGAKFYTNSDNFTGDNQDPFQPFVDRWFEFCDTDPEVQAFINSQPYHTGIWNSDTQQYEDASEEYPYRKYVFCYAEFVLKDFALRYGKYASSWTFDSAKHMGANGDDDESGLLEEQRLFQAFANAVWAGNPDCPVAFNNGRLSNDLFGDEAFPYARSTRFDDYTFGHAHNGNSDHASLAVNPIRNETVFASNYRHVTRMTETNGYVQLGGEWDWDDKVVGNYHSKLGTQSWRYSTPSAWSQDEFNQWNLEAVQAGGHMTWEGSIPRSGPVLRDWAQELIGNADDYLAVNAFPGPPAWTRKYTDLPDATVGKSYSHTLVEGEDFWDPEDDVITSISAITDGFFSSVPSWLTIAEDPDQAGSWILSGIPTESSATTHQFVLVATDINDEFGTRSVELQVLEAEQTLIAEWKFDEGEGTTVADSVSGAYEATRATGDWVADGAYGSAMYFDGTQEGLILPAGAFSEVSEANEITISMWVKGDSSQPVADTILGASDSSENRVFNIHLPWSSGEVIWDSGDASGYDRVREDAIESEYAGVWSHWVFTKSTDTGEMSIYRNGLLWHSDTNLTKEIGEAENVILGNSAGGEDSYHGAIDEVRIYSVALSSTEVFDLYGTYGFQNRYNLWFESFVETSSSGALNVSWNQDFDGDGISNLLEYVLNGDPTVMDFSILPEVVLNNSLDEYVFRFDRKTESISDTIQIFRYSTDLENWNSIDLTDEITASEVEIFNVDAEIQQIDIKLESTGLEEDGEIFGRLEVYFRE
ncbi:MAG: LamG-like jellyroll fold domain-containing protein [Bacteroidota bacterium]